MSATASLNELRPDWRRPDPFHVATLLASMGFRVLPTAVQTKIPCIGRWPERATTHPSVIAVWQQRYNPNWSILTGRENGVIVLDIDGDAGRAGLARLESELGPLPPTWRVNSGRIGGGEHIWLRPPPGTDDLRNQQPIPGYAIDVRGWHGHVVVPGSLHKSGRRYEWEPECAPDEVELAECPAAWWDWLPKKLAEPEARRRSRVSSRGSRVQRDHDPASRLIGDGDGFGGFQNPIYKNAIDYFFCAGGEAPAEIIISTLREMIDTAPKDQGRDVSRYMDGPDLPRIVERARDFVLSVKESDSEFNYEYD